MSRERIDQLIAQAQQTRFDNYESLFDIATELLELATTLHDAQATATAHVFLARYYSRSDAMLPSMEHVTEALRLYQELGDLEGEVRVHRTLSVNYFRMGKLDEGLVSSKRALQIIQQHQLRIIDEQALIDIVLYNNLGSVYFRLNQFNEAISCYEKAISLEQSDSGENLCLLYSNLADAHVELAQYDIALNYAQQSLRIATDNNLSPYFLNLSYSQIGNVYRSMKQYDKAFYYLLEALHNARVSKSQYAIVDTLLQVGRTYMEVKRYEEAVAAFVELIEINQRMQTQDRLDDVYLYLSELYEITNDEKQALHYYKLYVKLQKEMATHRLQQELAHLQVEFKIEQAKKDAEIYKLKNIELKEKTLEIERKAEQLEEAIHTVKVLSEIGRAITATFNFESMAGTVYDKVNSLMDAPVIGIGLLEDERIRYRFYMDSGERKSEFSIAVDSPSSLAVKCITERRELMINLIEEDTEYIYKKNGAEDHRPESVIFSPLILFDRVLGVMTVQSYHSYAYNENHIEMIRVLSSYLAISLNNSIINDALQSAVQELEVSATTDALTNIANRRHMMNLMQSEHRQLLDVGTIYSFIIADIDNFKAINDTYGHDVGDYVLQTVANHLRDNVRQGDAIGRWGGEEFVMLLPRATEEQALQMAVRLREMIQSLEVVYEGLRIKFTMTFGVVQARPDITVKELIKKADQALYRGKINGRNRIEVYHFM